jgi:hypothetical protein
MIYYKFAVLKKVIFFGLIMSFLFALFYSNRNVLFNLLKLNTVRHDEIDIDGNVFEKTYINNYPQKGCTYHLYLRVETKIKGKLGINWTELEFNEKNDRYIYDHDYYSDEFKIILNPDKTCRGKVKISYRFSSL